MRRALMVVFLASFLTVPALAREPALGSKAPTVRPTAVAPNGAASAPAPSARTATGEATSQEAAKRVAATEVQGWLALLDARRYADSWTAASSLFRQQITKDRWAASAERARNSVGLLTRRRLASATYTEDSVAGTQGPFVVLRYQSAFQKLPDASEVLTMQLERTGSWRTVGYCVTRRDLSLSVCHTVGGQPSQTLAIPASSLDSPAAANSLAGLVGTLNGARPAGAATEAPASPDPSPAADSPRLVAQPNPLASLVSALVGTAGTPVANQGAEGPNPATSTDLAIQPTASGPNALDAPGGPPRPTDVVAFEGSCDPATKSLAFKVTWQPAIYNGKPWAKYQVTGTGCAAPAFAGCCEAWVTRCPPGPHYAIVRADYSEIQPQVLSAVVQSRRYARLSGACR